MQIPKVTGERLGLIVGSSIAVESIPALAAEHSATTATVPTEAGPVRIYELGHAVLIHRHQATDDGFRPPHRIDHHRSVAALCAAGCDRVVAISSVGSLRGWPVGTVVAPFDFFAPGVAPSFFDDAQGHSVPQFDSAWRDQVLEAWTASSPTHIMDGGVYAQNPGPRFETPAEVRMLAEFADVVGMTVASECILSREAGLAYAAIATVDNLANGLGSTTLTTDEFRAGVGANAARLLADLASVIPVLANSPLRRTAMSPAPRPA